MLTKGDCVGLVACSNARALKTQGEQIQLIQALEEMGLNVEISKYIYETKYPIFSGTAKEKAEEFMRLYSDEKIKAIFDISGGDLTNEVLPYLDYELIKQYNKPVFGYSDVTTLLCAIYKKCEMNTYLYQIRNIIGSQADQQARWVRETLMGKSEELYSFDYHFIQRNRLEGEVVGGNIRCLLKLAGTPYMPDFTDKILFLEAMSGDVAKMTTYLNQCKQMGIFEQIRGVVLGSFSEMEKKAYQPTIEALVTTIIDNEELPIAKTSQIGHGEDSKALIIGKKLKLNK